MDTIKYKLWSYIFIICIIDYLQERMGSEIFLVWIYDLIIIKFVDI